MTEHARGCDRQIPVVRLFTVSEQPYRLTTCPRCGAQSVECINPNREAT